MSVRSFALAIAAVAALAGVSACNTSALTKVEMEVTFFPNAPQSDHAAALKACSHISPDIVPEPLVTSNLESNNVGDVRFRIDHADDHDLALLTECLNKQPGVAGVNTPDLTD